ncbi:MurR/RpiR family transcriptional regulator [Consotaella salsifontis]|uniref:Transcriptional regulator, RpiR family n=1 Tax=Consotaella salsifontis TaxID=1365950 RepID=A0A1T4S8C7_9HYPH|nr:MurR/RpiR family transcriptional regulator [Consotaella salsifontis]SKA24346.1 transcriptional regulator, RpiR family [Consotaella salsifontis]
MPAVVMVAFLFIRAHPGAMKKRSPLPPRTPAHRADGRLAGKMGRMYGVEAQPLQDHAVDVHSQPPLIARIRSHAPTMTRALERVASFVLADPHAVLYKSITELADEAESSEASVIRFCRELGYHGFQNFKLALAHELATLQQPAPSGTPGDIVQELVETAQTALQETERLLDRKTIEAVSALLMSARHVEIFGVAASAITAQYLEYKLSRLGIHAHSPRDAHLATMTSVSASADDLYILISSSGSTIDTLRVAESAHGRGARLVAITNRTKSPLAAICDFKLLASSPETPLTGGAFPSKISQLLIVDALANTITKLDPGRLKTIKETAESVSDRNI